MLYQCLTEQVLELMEEGVLGCLRGFETIALLHLLEGGVLLLGQCLGDVDGDVHYQVAITIAVSLQCRQTLATQAYGLAGLCAGLYLYLHTAVYGRYLHGSAQYCRGQVKEQVVDKVVVAAAQFGMGLNLHIHLYVAGIAIVAASIALALDGQYHAVLNTGGYLYLNDLFAACYASARAVRTLVLDYRALATAGRAHALLLHATEHGVHLTCNVAGAVACAAGLGLAVLRTGTMALCAGYVLLHLELLGGTLCHFFQREFYLQYLL